MLHESLSFHLPSDSKYDLAEEWGRKHAIIETYIGSAVRENRVFKPCLPTKLLCRLSPQGQFLYLENVLAQTHTDLTE